MNVARLLYVGSKILNYTEDEVFRMTLRKFYLIYNEYQELNGKKKRIQVCWICFKGLQRRLLRHIEALIELRRRNLCVLADDYRRTQKEYRR